MSLNNNTTHIIREFYDSPTVVNGSGLESQIQESNRYTYTNITELDLRDAFESLRPTTQMNNREFVVFTGSAGYNIYNRALLDVASRITVTSATTFSDALYYTSDDLYYTYTEVPTIGTYITENKLYFNGKVYAESKDPGRLKDLKKRLERINHG